MTFFEHLQTQTTDARQDLLRIRDHPGRTSGAGLAGLNM